MLDATLTAWPGRNDWMLSGPGLGLPNPDMLKSAAFQQFQIGSNDISESAYYFTDTGTAGQSLDGSDGTVHVLRFPGDPVHWREEACMGRRTMLSMLIQVTLSILSNYRGAS